MGIPERKEVLQSIRERLLENADELAYLECLDTGVPIRTIRDRKIKRLTGNFELFSECLSMMAGQTYQQNKQFLTMVTHEPVGVAALLAPWNSPLGLASAKLAPCIAFGNTCVLKPSEHTPMALARCVEILHEAGLPKGVVNLVNGRGSVTGAALVQHPEIDLVSFTGGTETGRSVMSSAARSLAPVALELGASPPISLPKPRISSRRWMAPFWRFTPITASSAWRVRESWCNARSRTGLSSDLLREPVKSVSAIPWTLIRKWVRSHSRSTWRRCFPMWKSPGRRELSYWSGKAR